MCGIAGYLGNKEAFPILLKGLKRLEYRGYDSSGIAVYKDNTIVMEKSKGKISFLENKINTKDFLNSSVGIAHTRWATHGEPNDVNAHPLFSNSKNLVMVHNGIIENYASLKEELLKVGYKFESDTDTEVLVNFIEYIKEKKNIKLGKAVQIALNQVIGAYAIAIIDKNKPNEIVVAKLGSPLAIGLGKDEYFIGSDVTPFIEHTNSVIYLEDGELAIIRKCKDLVIRVISSDSKVEQPFVEQLKLNLEKIEKGNYDYFMLKEIYEQPKVVFDTFRGRLNVKKGFIRMSGIDNHLNKLVNANRIVVVACGTSWHAGLLGEYLFESLAKISVEVEYASEFRYRNPVINQDDVVFAISQSGETADTLAAIKLAKEKGAFVFGICNVVSSSIARESETGAYTHAGPEIGVASTKAFTTQITLLVLIALKLANHRGTISNTEFRKYLLEMESIPNKIEKTLENNEQILEIAEIYKNATNFLYLGRGFNFPVALEGALKLKEISYIHAEGYPAAEMKHGPIALIDEQMPVVVIATKKGNFEKVLSNIEEIKSRKGKIIAIVNKQNDTLKKLADHIIIIPETLEPFSPLVSIIPLQLLSYHIAILRGCNVDQPRNLAKSVTVE